MGEIMFSWVQDLWRRLVTKKEELLAKRSGKCPDCGSKRRKVNRDPKMFEGYNEMGVRQKYIYDTSVHCVECNRILVRRREEYRHPQPWFQEYLHSE